MHFVRCCLFDFFFFFDRLNWRAWCLMKKDRENQRRPTSNVTVRYFAWTQQPTHELDRRRSTSSSCTCLWGTHVRGNVRTRYRVEQGLRLPMKKKMNVEERINLNKLVPSPFRHTRTHTRSNASRRFRLLQNFMKNAKIASPRAVFSLKFHRIWNPTQFAKFIPLPLNFQLSDRISRQACS